MHTFRSLAFAIGVALAASLAACGTTSPLPSGPTATASVNVSAAAPTSGYVPPASSSYAVPVVGQSVYPSRSSRVVDPYLMSGYSTGRREVSSPSAFVRAAKACLRWYGVYAETNADNGCYVAANTHLICTADVPESIPVGCRREANAAGKPPRS